MKKGGGATRSMAAASDNGGQVSEAADDLLRDPAILYGAVRAASRGRTGNERERGLLYLALTSRLLPEPISLVVQGGGVRRRHDLVSSVLALMPAEAFVEYTSVDPKGLAYSSQDLRHRHLVLHGVDAGERGRTLLAALASQPEVHLLHRTSQGLVEITREGPTGIVTTDTALGEHLLDRGLAWPLDLSGAPMRAPESRLPPRGELVDARVWQCAQGMLEGHEVVVPFEKALTEAIGLDAIPKDENDRTDDQARLMALIRASALLHQRHREQDDDGRIVATLDDYQLVYGLADELFTLEAQDLAPQVIAVGEAVEDLLKEQQHKANAKDEDTAEACVMRVALERRLEWSTRVVNKWVARAEEAGVVEVEHARGRRPARLRRGSHPLVTSLLPEPASLAESQEKETGEVQH